MSTSFLFSAKSIERRGDEAFDCATKLQQTPVPLSLTSVWVFSIFVAKFDWRPNQELTLLAQT
jgi:hypothetical protein